MKTALFLYPIVLNDKFYQFKTVISDKMFNLFIF